MKKKDVIWLFMAFALWRIALQVILLVGVHLIHNQTEFLGGGIANYLRNPGFWGWANFDGEHYLS